MPSAFAMGIGSTLPVADHEKRLCLTQASTISLESMVAILDRPARGFKRRLPCYGDAAGSGPAWFSEVPSSDPIGENLHTGAPPPWTPETSFDGSYDEEDRDQDRAAHHGSTTD